MKTAINHRWAILGAITLLVALSSGGAWARSDSAHHDYREPQESQLIEHGHYTNKRGESVHSPAHTKNGGVPTGATAHCGDGSYSFSHSHSGTCSRHGGVAGWE